MHVPFAFKKLLIRKNSDSHSLHGMGMRNFQCALQFSITSINVIEPNIIYMQEYIKYRTAESI